MKFKNIIILGVLIIIGFNIHGQDKVKTKTTNHQTSNNLSNDELKAKFTADLIAYLEAFNVGDWDGVTKMINPNVLELISKEQMIHTFIQMEESGMKLITDFIKVDKISQVVNYEDYKYCMVYYNGKITIKLSGTMLDHQNGLNQSLSEAYGKTNVNYDDTKQEFEINAIKSMIAASIINSSDWTYIEFNNKKDEILELIIPENVLEQLLD